MGWYQDDESDTECFERVVFFGELVAIYPLGAAREVFAVSSADAITVDERTPLRGEP